MNRMPAVEPMATVVMRTHHLLVGATWKVYIFKRCQWKCARYSGLKNRRLATINAKISCRRAKVVFRCRHLTNIEVRRFHVFPLVVVVDGAYRTGDDTGGDGHRDHFNKGNNATDNNRIILVIKQDFTQSAVKTEIKKERIIHKSYIKNNTTFGERYFNELVHIGLLYLIWFISLFHTNSINIGNGTEKAIKKNTIESKLKHWESFLFFSFQTVTPVRLKHMNYA